MTDPALSIAKILNTIKSSEIDLDNISIQDKDLAQKINNILKNNPSTSTVKKCPECDKPFIELPFDNIKIDYCPRCSSLWFDNGELASIVNTSKDIYSGDTKSRKSKFKCPVCRKDMEEHVYFRKNNLLVDVCGAHGIYIQKGELERITSIKDKNLL